jgi:hypothetical protein
MLAGAEQQLATEAAMDIDLDAPGTEPSKTSVFRPCSDRHWYLYGAEWPAGLDRCGITPIRLSDQRAWIGAVSHRSD